MPLSRSLDGVSVSLLNTQVDWINITVIDSLLVHTLGANALSMPYNKYLV